MSDKNNYAARYFKTATVVLPYPEWNALKHLAKKSHVKIGEYIHAIVKDAIADEGLDVQRFRAQGCTEQGKAGEASRAVSS